MKSITAIKNIVSVEMLKELPFPLPPLAEQKSIVSKVDELMALCDKLEARRQKKQEIQSKLNSAALERMLSAENQEEFEQYWQRICESFDLLYDNPENVEKLRQAILQLAVQGKLVPHNPEDEPASSIIKSIFDERKRLYKAKCELALLKDGRKPKAPRLKLKEIPEKSTNLKTPESWQTCFFEDIADSKENAIKAGPFGSALTKSCYVEYGYKIYGQEQVIKEDASYGDYYINEQKYLELKSCEISPGDILISLVGTIGKVLILPEDCEPGIINPRLIKLSLHPIIYKKYIKLYLTSPVAKEILINEAHGGTMNILNLQILKNLPIPLPPLEEQKRIVEKVEQLMGLCDELESKLRKSREDNEKLMEAIVKGLLEGASIEKTELEKPVPLQVASIQLK